MVLAIQNFTPHLNIIPCVINSSIVNFRKKIYHVFLQISFGRSHLGIVLMAISFSYWDDCVDPEDLEAMWNVADVSAEWIKAGEDRSQKVHLSRDPDGQPYLTQTEMRAVADIIIGRDFNSELDLGMMCAIAELESDRQLLVTNSSNISGEPSMGLMQLLPKTTRWLMSELGYCSYEMQEDTQFLFKPFVNVYFGAAYIKWLSNFDNKKRSEEFIVRAYKGSTKKATHKSTLRYWKSYLSVKESFPYRRKSVEGSPPPACVPVPASSENSKDGSDEACWDSIVSPEDMEAMWNQVEVRKLWNRSKQKRGKVRLILDENKRPYISRLEMKAVADIVLFKHLSTMKIKSTVICAIGEVLSKRFVDGLEERPGIMGIDYSTAYWLYLELGYRDYKLESVEDLKNPFVSMYFGAAYVAWLATYEERERTPDFFVQAYFVGPTNVNPEETSTLWLKFEETLSKFEESRRDSDTCCIM